MGFIIEMPTGCAPWHVEVRGESFYLGTSEFDSEQAFRSIHAAPYSKHGNDHGRFVIPHAQLPAMLAALTSFDPADHRREEVPPPAEDPWTVTSGPGGVEISGPVVIYQGRDANGQYPWERPGGTPVWADTWTVEIRYDHLPHLLVALRRTEDQ